MKDRLLSKNGNARDINFDSSGLPADIGNTRPIGWYNANQAAIGNTNNNVQAAIEDLYSLTVDPIKINGVYISTDGSSPESTSHVATISFSGAEIDEIIEEETFFILGEHFKFAALTTLESVITEILERFVLLVTQEKLVTKAERRDLYTIELTFQDNVPKILDINYTKNGITYIVATDTQGNPGYGTWLKLGHEDKFEERLHYFKRIA